MESGGVSRCLVEEFDSVGEGEVRICRTQGSETGKTCVTLNADTFFDEDRGGARSLEKREVATVGKKSDLAGLGVFDPGDSVDGSLAGSIESATKFLGNV
jgi:hypothetical protein